MHEGPNRLIICNGYKDHDYIRLALLGRKLGQENHPRRRAALRNRRHHPPFRGDRREAADRLPRQAADPRRGQVGDVDRRQRQVRTQHRGNPLRLRKAEGRQAAAVPAPRSFPYRLPGPQYHHDQERGDRGHPLLLPAREDGLPDGLPRRRRRPGHRLRRLADELRELDELLDGGVRPRRRLQRPRDLHQRRRRRARYRQRVRPRRRGPPLHAGRRGVRADQQARIARQAAPAESEAQGRHRPRGDAEEQDRSSAASSAFTTRCRRRRRRSRSSTSATSTWRTAPPPSRSTGRSASRSPRKAASPATSPRSSTTSTRSSPTSMSATSRSSSRCSTTGR